MNKIERAIYEAKHRLEEAEAQSTILLAEIKVRKQHLITLEAIKDNDSIPHQEGMLIAKQQN